MGKRKRVLLVTTLLILLLVGALMFLIHTLESPSEGLITQSGLQPKKQTVYKQTQQYSDSYISFSYPGVFKIVTAPKSAGYLDTINLNSSDRSGAYIAISIMNGTLDNDSGVSYRRQHSELYRIASVNSVSETFIKLGGDYEKTGYIAHNGLILSISLTSPLSEDLGTTYDTLAKSLQWK